MKSAVNVLSAISLAIASGLAISSSAKADSASVVMKPSMTLGLANQIADACQDWAEDRNLNVTIAILDEGAHLLHFRRMDGTAVGAGELSIRKAKTSAIFPYPTHEWQPLIYGEEGEEPILRGVEHMPTIAIFGGGVPIITADGHHIGAIGVGGASPKEETECGNAAIEAASDILRAH